MAENRQYAGPHLAAEVLIDDSRYALVVRNDLTDEQAANFGFTFDPEDISSGKSFAFKTISVSDEFAAKLDRATFEDADGNTVACFPRIGGTPGEPVDLPHLNPSTVPVTLDDGTELTAAEADERAYTAAAAGEVLDTAAIDAGAPETVNRDDAARKRLADIDARLEAIEAALGADDDLSDDDLDKLTDEQSRLTAERNDIEQALAAGKGN